jgi:porin
MGLGLVLGVSRTAAQPAVEARLDYTAESVAVLAGGVERGAVLLDNVDATVTLRADSLVGWPGLTAHVYGLGNQGGAPSSLVGDAQATSNIEAPLAWRIYEAWLQQRLGDRASLLVGLYDVNSEFDVNRTGRLFLHSSHGIGAAFGTSGRTGPSIFPVTSLGSRLRVRVRDRAYAQAAVLDGVPGRPSDPVGTAIRLGQGILAAAEVGLLRGPDATPRVGRTTEAPIRAKLALGGWAYSTDLPEWPTVNTVRGVEQSGGSAGLYLLAEGRLLREDGTADQGLAAFGRLGAARDRHNRFARYLGAGLVYTGALPGREVDQVGLAVAAAFNGTAYERAQRRVGQATTSAEVSVEGTYAAAVAPWLTLTGDAQVVVNPNTDPSIPNALLVGLRAVVSL